MRVFFRNIKYGVENLIKWLPIIWRDRDWDYEFLLLIMSFKMNSMAKLHKKHGNSVYSDKYAEQLDDCAKLAERVANNDYDGNFKEHEELANKDLDLLFSNMRKNIQDWWD